MLLYRRKQLDLLDEKKQAALVSDLNKSIDETNKEFSNKQLKITHYLTRDQVINDFDDDEITEELSESEEDYLDGTLTDIDDCLDIDTECIYNSAKGSSG